MPRQSWQQKTNVGRKRLPQNLPTSTICIKTYVPDDYEYIGLFIGALNRLAMQSIYDRDETKKAKEVALVWTNANQKTFSSLAEGCCDEIEQDCPPNGGNGCYLPACITTESSLNEFVINIEECCDMTVIVNIKDCCCGENTVGSTGQFGGGQSSGGGASGSWVVEEDKPAQITSGLEYGITQCDFVTTTMEAILDSCRELIQVVDDNAESLDSVVEGIANAVGTIPFLGDVAGGVASWASGVLTTGSAATLSMLNDNDFRFMVQSAWVKAHGNKGRITGITRNDLLATTQYMHLTWLQSNVVLFPRIVMDGIFRMLSINKINSRLLIAQGTANEELCNYIWAGAEQEYLPPPSQASLPVPGLGFTFEWARVFDFTIDQQDWVATTNFAVYNAGVGWTKNNSAEAFDYFIEIYVPLATTLTGIVVYLSQPMGGTSNNMNLSTGSGSVGQFSGGTEEGVNPIIRAIDNQVISGNLYLWMREFLYTNSAADDLQFHITKIELYGTGTAPTVGEPL